MLNLPWAIQQLAKNIHSYKTSSSALLLLSLLLYYPCNSFYLYYNYNISVTIKGCVHIPYLIIPSWQGQTVCNGKPISVHLKITGMAAKNPFKQNTTKTCHLIPLQINLNATELWCSLYLLYRITFFNCRWNNTN